MISIFLSEIRVQLSLGAILAVNRTVFKPLPPQELFHRPFIGGASVVVQCQCYKQNLFNGDHSLTSTYFVLRSA